MSTTKTSAIIIEIKKKYPFKIDEIYRPGIQTDSNVNNKGMTVRYPETVASS